MGFTPVITAVLAGSVLPDERLTRQIILGLLGGLTGIALMVGPGALLDLGAEVWGQVAIIGATLCYPASTVYIRRFAKRPPLEMAAGSSLVGSVAMVLVVFVSGADVGSVEISTSSLGAVVYLGLVSTAAANLTYFYLVPRLGATRMSQVNFGIPVAGALLGVLVLGETLAVHQIAALILIIGSVWLTTTAKRVKQS